MAQGLQVASDGQRLNSPGGQMGALCEPFEDSLVQV